MKSTFFSIEFSNLVLGSVHMLETGDAGGRCEAGHV